MAYLLSPRPSSIRINSVNIQSNCLLVCLFLYIFYYFLKKHDNLFRNFAKIYGGYYPCPRGLLSGIFAHFFVSLFFYVPLFLERLSIALHYFFRDVLDITERVISPRQPFHSISLSARNNFEVFWGSFGVFYSILRDLTLRDFVQIFFILLGQSRN